MKQDDCIFVDRPKECLSCLDGRKLKCLINKQHLIVRPEAKKELIELLSANMNSPTRYKKVSGEAGRSR